MAAFGLVAMTAACAIFAVWHRRPSAVWAYAPLMVIGSVLYGI